MVSKRELKLKCFTTSWSILPKLNSCRISLNPVWSDKKFWCNWKNGSHKGIHGKDAQKKSDWTGWMFSWNWIFNFIHEKLAPMFSHSWFLGRRVYLYFALLRTSLVSRPFGLSFHCSNRSSGISCQNLVQGQSWQMGAKRGSPNYYMCFREREREMCGNFKGQTTTSWYAADEEGLVCKKKGFWYREGIFVIRKRETFHLLLIMKGCDGVVFGKNAFLRD